jgi:hypothetical protein
MEWAIVAGAWIGVGTVMLGFFADRLIKSRRSCPRCGKSLFVIGKSRTCTCGAEVRRD